MVNRFHIFTSFRNFRKAATASAAFFVPQAKFYRHYKLISCLTFLLFASMAGLANAEVNHRAAKNKVEIYSESNISSILESNVAMSEEKPTIIQTPSAQTDGSKNSNIHIEIKSSHRSQGGNLEQRSTIANETRGVTQTITKENADGRSSVHFEINADSNTEVRVRERGNGLRIDIKEEKEH